MRFMIGCPDINHLTLVHALYVDVLFVGDILTSMPHNYAHLTLLTRRALLWSLHKI